MREMNPIFVGWERPALEQAVEELSRFYQNGTLDLTDVLLVVPTQHAGRRLREALAAWAAARDGAVLAGECITPDQLVAVPDAAEPVHELAAWLQVLQQHGASMRALLPKGIAHFTFDGLLGLAERIIRLRGLLCDEGLLMQQVPERDKDPVEAERWADLVELEQRYLEKIAQWKLTDRCVGRIAAAQAPEISAQEVVLLFVPDIPPLSLQALERVEPPIRILVRAPVAMAADFDRWGIPIPERWQQRHLPLRQEQLVVRATPGQLIESMNEVLDRAETLSGVSMGVPDSELLPGIKGMLKERGLHGFDPAGETMGAHPLFRCLELMGDYMQQSSFEALAVVLRHPHVLDYLAGRREAFPRVEFLKQLDRFEQDFLPVRVAPEQIPDALELLQFGVQEVLGLLEVFAGEVLSTSIPAGLQQLYQGQSIQDPSFKEVAEAIMKQVGSLGELEGLVELKSVDRFRLFLRLMRSQRRYDDRRQESMDLLGWVELAWEDASVLLVAGMHEQAVPESVTGDLFLPDRARAAMGLRDNRYLFARDLYLLESTLAARPAGQTVLFTSRLALSGEPLKPSRLLFQCTDAELPGRVEHLFQECGDAVADGEVSDEEGFVLKPLRVAPPQKVSVTAFREYLACPFRYYLGRVLRMNQRVAVHKLEMDALDFGNVVHGALEALFGAGPHDEPEPEPMAEFLCDHVADVMRSRYGTALSVPLMIQQEALFQRVRAAANVQAAQVREGWHMRQSELKLESDLLSNDVLVTGIVDRVDEHEDGRIRVLDYKTFEKAKTPLEGHLAKVRDDTPEYARCEETHQWVDLQLPLYALMLQERFGPDIQCGYFVLPKAVSQTGLYLFDELGGLLPSARACAETVLEQIYAGVFGPPRERVLYDDFASIVPWAASVS